MFEVLYVTSHRHHVVVLAPRPVARDHNILKIWHKASNASLHISFFSRASVCQLHMCMTVKTRLTTLNDLNIHEISNFSLVKIALQKFYTVLFYYFTQTFEFQVKPGHIWSNYIARFLNFSLTSIYKEKTKGHTHRFHSFSRVDTTTGVALRHN